MAIECNFRDHTPDPDSYPITGFPEFRSYAEVHHFFKEHRRRLTQDQIDQLVYIHDELQRRPIATLKKKSGHLEAKLQNLWSEAKASSPDKTAQLTYLAKGAAEMLGESGIRQVDHVITLYREVGTKYVNRAIIELAGEQLTVEQRFKYLRYRANKMKDAS